MQSIAFQCFRHINLDQIYLYNFEFWLIRTLLILLPFCIGLVISGLVLSGHILIFQPRSLGSDHVAKFPKLYIYIIYFVVC